MFMSYEYQACMFLRLRHPPCRRITRLDDTAMEELIEAEMKAVKQRLFATRKQGTGKRIGRLPSMKVAVLRAQAEPIVLARLSSGVETALSTPLASSSSLLSSTKSSSSSSSSSSSLSSSVSSISSTLPVFGEQFLSGLILPGATHRGNKVIKFVSMLFKAAPELWSKYSDAAEVSAEFQIAGKSQRTAVYNFMCNSIEAAAPDFIDRIGIPTSEAELMISARSWVDLLASIPADTAPPPPPPQTSAPTAALLAVVPPSTGTPSTQPADVESQQLREQMARQIAELQAQLVNSQAEALTRQAEALASKAEALKQARLREEEKAQMLQRERMIAMAYQHQAAAAAAKALAATTSSSSAVARVAETRLDSGSTRGVKRLKTDSGSAPRPRPRGNAPFTALSARYKQRVVLESSKAVTDRVGASADGRVAVAAQLVKSPTSFNLLLKLRRNQK